MKNTSDPFLLFTQAYQAGGIENVRRVWDIKDNFFHKRLPSWNNAVGHALEEGAKKDDELLDFILERIKPSEHQIQLGEGLFRAVQWGNNKAFEKIFALMWFPIASKKMEQLVMGAAERGNHVIMKLLIPHAQNFNFDHILNKAALNGNLETLKLLVPHVHTTQQWVQAFGSAHAKEHIDSALFLFDQAPLDARRKIINDATDRGQHGILDGVLDKCTLEDLEWIEPGMRTWAPHMTLPRVLAHKSKLDIQGELGEQPKECGIRDRRKM